MEEGLLPHQRSVDADAHSAIEEERRLAYVGVTRLPFAALPGKAPNSYLMEDHRLALLPVPRELAKT